MNPLVNKVNRSSAKHWLNELYAKKNVFETVCSLKMTATSDSIAGVFDEFWTRQVIPQVIGDLFPQEWKSLRSEKRLRWRSYTTEVRWQCLVLGTNVPKLRLFLAAESKFEDALLLNDYAEAERALDGIKKQFGVSLWLICATERLLAGSKGYGALKAYARSVYSVADADWISRLSAHYGSFLYEPDVDFLQFELSIEDAIRNRHLNRSAASVLKHMLCPISFYDSDLVATVLHLEGNGSLIDRFVAVRTTSVMELARNVDRRRVREIRKWWAPLAHELHVDPLCWWTSAVSGKASELPRSRASTRFAASIDSYTSGDYAGVVANLSTGTAPTEIDELELACRAAVRLGNVDWENHKSTWWTAAKAAIELMQKTERSAQASLELLNIAYKNQQGRWGLQVYWLLYRYTSSPRSKTFGLCERQSALCGAAGNPRSIEILHRHGLLRGKISMLAAKRASALFEAVVLGHRKELEELYRTSKIDERRYLKYSGDIHVRQEHFEKASHDYRRLRQFSDALSTDEALQGLAVCLIALEDVDAIINLVVDEYVVSPNQAKELPLTELGLLVRARSPRSKRGTDLALFWHVVGKFTQIHAGPRIAAAWERSLSVLGVAHASEYLRERSELTPRELVFFREVCVPNVIDIATSLYPSSSSVRTERMSVLRELLRLDVRHKAKYDEELGALAEEQILFETSQELEAGKIDVDIEAFRQDIYPVLRVLQERSAASDANSNDEALGDLIVNAVELNEGTPIQLVIPRNQRRQLAQTIISRATSSFVENTNYGLEPSLSINIRHGTVTGHLRACFERHHLITTKTELTETYGDNNYWNDSGLPGQTFELVNSASKELSKVVDEELRALKDDVLQIFNPELKKRGLFKYFVGDELITRIQSLAIVEGTAPQILDEVAQWLISQTNDNFSEVREYVRRNVPRTLINAIDIFESKSKTGVSDLDAAISDACHHARTDVQNAGGEIANWFNWARTQYMHEVTYRQVAKIAEKAIRTATGSKQWTLTLSGSAMDDRVQGTYLRTLVTIVCNLLDNAVRYGRVVDESTPIQCVVGCSNGELSIYVQSDLPDEPNRSVHVNRLTDSVKKLDLDTWRSLLSKEGGSGLAKIRGKLEQLGVKNGKVFFEVSSNECRVGTKWTV